MVEGLPHELLAKYLPPGRRMVMYRTCKAIKHFLESLANRTPECLRLSICVRLITRPKHLPTLFAALSQKFRVEGLDMRGIKITEEVLREFSRRKSIDWGHLRSLYTGDAYIRPIMTDTVLAWLERCGNLTATDVFGRIELGDRAWALARGCKKLELSLLRRQYAGFETFADELGKCTRVEELDLSGNGVVLSNWPDKLQDALSKLQELRMVSFAGCNPSPAVLNVIIPGCSASQATLQRMDLSHMVMVKSTALVLGMLLKGCQNLWDLNLNNTSLSYDDVDQLKKGLVHGVSLLQPCTVVVSDHLQLVTHLRF